MNRTRRTVLAGGLALLSGCVSAPQRRTRRRDTDPIENHSVIQQATYDPSWESPTEPPSTRVQLTPVVKHLEIPWDLAFAPTGDFFITERTGRVRKFDFQNLTTIARIGDAIDAGVRPPTPNPTSSAEQWFLRGGEGGLLGIAVHPKYPDPAFIYVYYTRRTWLGIGPKENVVARLDTEDDEVTKSLTIIMDGIPAGRVHNGGRLAFGPDNYLWITTGDSGNAELAQDESSLAGKILRVNEFGAPATDNPAVSGRDPRIYTVGHRNPQGLAWMPDGTPLITEHGPSGRDEVSVLEPGANYGWPHARTPVEYQETDHHRPIVNTPVVRSWAPSGCVFYRRNRLPKWTNRLLVGTLIAQQLKILTLYQDTVPQSNRSAGRAFDAEWLDDSYTVTSHSTLVNEVGRIRGIEQGPDGYLYLITSNRDGRAREGFPRAIDDVVVRLELLES